MFATFRLLLLLSFLSLLTSAQSEDQRQILLNLKSTLHNSNSKLFHSWNATNSVCTFLGVTCNSLNSVTEINLSNQTLSGVLPFDSLCKLPSLQKLVFGYNYLNGKVSEDIRNCVKLQYLDLGNNLFSLRDLFSSSLLAPLVNKKSGVSLESYTPTFPLEKFSNFIQQVTKKKKKQWP